jgi:hypothetical protein
MIQEIPPHQRALKLDHDVSEKTDEQGAAL